MIVKSAEFVKSAVKPAHYPEADLPEIAFAGRSNVGKSSLINTLLNRKHLVKTGSTPGRTQLINFFEINNAFSFVDLPGYGYAKVPAAVQKQWGPMVETYLGSRATLAGVVLILDVRRDPRREEFDLMDWLVANDLRYILVLTKADKFSKTRLAQHRRRIAQSLGISEETPILFSAKSRLGKEPLWRAIEERLATFSRPEG